MLKLYMDRGSRKEAGRVMCVAAALFEPFHYERFLHEWQPLLDEWGASAFHATDFYPGARNSPFHRKNPDGTLNRAKVAQFERDSRRIPEIIAAHVHELFVLTFKEQEYETLAPENWRAQFGGVHRVAAQLMAGGVGHWAKRTGYGGEIAYFFETGDAEEASVSDALSKLFIDKTQRAHTRMATMPIGVDKGKVRGIEVADLLAWHWNKWAVESMAVLDGKRRPMRKDVGRLIELLSQKGKKIHVSTVTGVALEEFLVAHGCHRTTTMASVADASSAVLLSRADALARKGHAREQP